MFHVEHIHNSKAFLEKFIHGAKCLGFSFSEETLNKFWLHYLELCRWNRSVNLTGLQTEEERTVLLFVDSLAGSLAPSVSTDTPLVALACGSKSINKTDFPDTAKEALMLIAVVVFPTPPF